MSEPRFVVREVVGFRQPIPAHSRTVPGASYCVLDSRILYRNVGEYRSETIVGYPGMVLGRARAQALADARAAELNAAYSREALSPRNGKAV